MARTKRRRSRFYLIYLFLMLALFGALAITLVRLAPPDFWTALKTTYLTPDAGATP